MSTHWWLGSLIAFSVASAACVAQTSGRLYAVRFTTGPAWDAARAPQEQVGFAEHSANLARLRREDVLVLGARYGDTGLVVVRAADDAAARALFTDDPTLATGVFAIAVDEFQPFYHGTTWQLATPEALVLRAYLAAFNRRDAAAVTALCAEGFRLFSVDGDQVGTDVEGRGALREWLTNYFQSVPTVRSEFLSIDQTGAILTVRERATWTSREGTQVSQQSIGVYEIRDGAIQRTWYFAAVRDAPR